MFPIPIFKVIRITRLKWSSLQTPQARKLCRVIFAYCTSLWMGPVKLETFGVPHCMRPSSLSDFNYQLWRTSLIMLMRSLVYPPYRFRWWPSARCKSSTFSWPIQESPLRPMRHLNVRLPADFHSIENNLRPTAIKFHQSQCLELLVTRFCIWKANAVFSPLGSNSDFHLLTTIEQTVPPHEQIFIAQWLAALPILPPAHAPI